MIERVHTPVNANKLPSHGELGWLFALGSVSEWNFGCSTLNPTAAGSGWASIGGPGAGRVDGWQRASHRRVTPIPWSDLSGVSMPEPPQSVPVGPGFSLLNGQQQMHPSGREKGSQSAAPFQAAGAFTLFIPFRQRELSSTGSWPIRTLTSRCLHGWPKNGPRGSRCVSLSGQGLTELSPLGRHPLFAGVYQVGVVLSSDSHVLPLLAFSSPPVHCLSLLSFTITYL